MNMEDENEKKYHGYLILSRQLKHLRKELGSNLFHFYIDLVMEARWGRKYKKTFCKIMMTQSELASELGVDQGTISKKIAELKKRNKNSIIQNKRSITICFLPLFLYEVASKMPFNDYANWNEVYEDMHKIDAELQERYEKRHNSGTQNDPLSINTSSKVSSSLSSGEDDYIDVDEVAIGIERMNRERKGSDES